MAKCNKQGRARALAVVKPRCEACKDTGALHLVAHWTGLDIGPAVVTCPHCSYPYLPIQTYARKAS
jgi:hypothetical protein